MNTLRPLLLLTALAPACTSTLYTVEHESTLEAKDGVVYALPQKQLVVSFDVTTTKTSYGQWSCLNPFLGLPAIARHDELCRLTAQKAFDLLDPPNNELRPRQIPEQCAEATPQAETGNQTPTCATATFNAINSTASLAAFLATKPKLLIPQIAPKHKLTGQRIAEQVIPDPEQIYRIDLDTNERNRSRTLKFGLSDDGRLTSSDALLVDARPQMAAAGIRTTANVVGKVVGLALGTAGAGDSTPSAQPQPTTNNQLKCTDFGDACLAAVRLLELVTDRDKLLANASASLIPTAKGELARLARLDAEIAALEKLFYPTQTKTVTTWTELVDPSIGAAGTWCFEPTTGKVGPSTSCATKPEHKLELEITALPSALTTSPPPTPSAALDDQGLRYRVPQWVTIELLAAGRPVLVQRTTIPQLGAVQVLPNQVHGHNNHLVVELSPTTGMLVRLEFVDERDYSDTIDALGEGSATVLDAAAAAEPAEDPSEIDAKKQELELLELDRQISCYETLGAPCPGKDGDSEE